MQHLFEACALDLSNLYVSNLTVTSTLPSQALAHNCEFDNANVGPISAAGVLYIALLTDRETLSGNLRSVLGPAISGSSRLDLKLPEAHCVFADAQANTS